MASLGKYEMFETVLCLKTTFIWIIKNSPTQKQITSYPFMALEDATVLDTFLTVLKINFSKKSTIKGIRFVHHSIFTGKVLLKKLKVFAVA